MIRSLSAIALVAFCSAARADDKAMTPEALAREVAPYLDDQTLVVVHVDLTKLEPEAILKQFSKLGAPEKAVDEMKKQAKMVQQMIDGAGLRRMHVVYGLTEIPEQPPLLVLPLGNEKGKDAVVGLATLAGLKSWDNEGTLILGSERGIKRVRNQKPSARPDLARALAAGDGAAVTVVLTANDDLRKAVEELVPRLPAELGGAPGTVLTRGLKWVSFGLNVAPTASFTVTVQASDEAAAKSLRGIATAGLKTLGKDKDVREAWPEFEKLSDALTPSINGERLTLNLREDRIVALVKPAFVRVHTAADRAVVMNNMKQVGLACHAYLDVNGTFPASASYDKQNKPLLSWRVHVLPFIDQEQLYKEFKLDEPWDSEHNRKLIKRMPKIFAGSNAKLSEQGRTTIVLPTGEGTAFKGRKGIAIKDVTDGTSNTILTLEAAEENAVIWTKPDDLKIDPKNPARGLNKTSAKGFTVGFMDGSVRFLPATIDLKTLAALFTPDGGEVVQMP